MRIRKIDAPDEPAEILLEKVLGRALAGVPDLHLVRRNVEDFDDLFLIALEPVAGREHGRRSTLQVHERGLAATAWLRSVGGPPTAREARHDGGAQQKSGGERAQFPDW